MERRKNKRLLCETGRSAYPLFGDRYDDDEGRTDQEKTDMPEESMVITSIPGENRTQGDVIGQSAQRID